MLRTGVVGMGGMGNYRLQVARQNPDTPVVAFYEPDPKRRAEAEAKYGVPGYADLGAFFERERLGLVIITSPDYTHRAPAVMAAEHGVHVLVEKPLASTVEDAEAIVAAADRAGVKGHVCFQNRYTPQFILAQRAVMKGDVGGLITLTCRANAKVPRIAWAGQTTVAWFLMSHSIDLGMWISGMRPKTVYASGVKKRLVAAGQPTYDVIHATFVNEDGTDAVYEGSWTLPDAHPSYLDFTYEVTGTQGSVKASTTDEGVQVITDRMRFGPLDGVALTDGMRGMHVDMYHQFVKAILEDREPFVSLKDGLINTRILVALHRSLETGQTEQIA
ncbi:MAG: Gfo/Idh/MocA family oxidoreductase [Candidatus Latescibacteria bacterium]|nr:Gfo/Idh/MocA family oxidoreductase [Candidatus Latescibacterota bacterium]